MKKVDVWETVANVAMHVERQLASRGIAERTIGAFSVAETLSHMNSCASTLHRIATERANGFRTEAARKRASATEKRTTESLRAHADRLCLTAEVGVMGYVELTSGSRRLGCLPLRG